MIPKEIVKKERLKANQKLKAIILRRDSPLTATFGILKNWKKPTDKIMREIDKELWFEE